MISTLLVGGLFLTLMMAGLIKFLFPKASHD